MGGEGEEGGGEGKGKGKGEGVGEWKGHSNPPPKSLATGLFTISFQVQNSPVPQIFSTMVC